MKKIIIFLGLSLIMLNSFSQKYILLKFKTPEQVPIVELSAITKNYTFKSNDEDFLNIINKYKIIDFGKEYPSAHLVKHKNAPILDLYYHIKCDSISTLSLYKQLVESKKKSIENEIDLIAPSVLLALPNDYDITNYIAGQPNGIPPFASASSKLQNDLINVEEAWNITTGNPNIRTADIDLNFLRTHEELNGQIGVDFASTFIENGLSHGTAVASLIAGKTNNGVGIASVGYNTKLDLYDLQTDQNLSVPSDIDQFISASVNGARVINCSFQGLYNIASAQLTIDMLHETYHTVFVAAAGNGLGQGNYSPSDNSNIYPASFNHVISVTSIGYIINSGNFSLNTSASNFKDVHQYFGWHNNNSFTHSHGLRVDLSAPGHDIIVAYGHNSNNIQQYTRGGGTSFTAPIVAGAAALILSVNPNLNPDDVKAILKSTSRDIYEEPLNFPYINWLGTGRLDVGKAVLKAQTWIPNTGIVQSPSPTINSSIIYSNGLTTVEIFNSINPPSATPPYIRQFQYKFYATGTSNSGNYKWLVFKKNTIGPPDAPIIRYGNSITLTPGIDFPFNDTDPYGQFTICVRNNDNIPSVYTTQNRQILLATPPPGSYACLSDVFLSGAYNHVGGTYGSGNARIVESATWIKYNSGYTPVDNSMILKLDANPINGFVEFNPLTTSDQFISTPNYLGALVVEAYNGCTLGSPLKNVPIQNDNLSENKIDFENEIRISPNPSSGVFILDNIPLNSTIEVYNTLGIKCLSINSKNQKKVMLDLTSKPNGMYFIIINNSITKKIIKF